MAYPDLIIIALYFVAVIGMGAWYSRRAAHDLESYFLGGKSIHWLALAMSGSVSNFDITGTMWIVSIIYLLGMKSMWHHWMWGFLMGAFFRVYMGKWVRRSNVMTAAEWMVTRFGDGIQGQLARTTYALMAILTQAGFIGYAFQGIGKFAAVYVPLEALANYTSLPWLQNLVTVHEAPVLAILIMGATTLYVVMGGLYSVVVTDILQTVILTVASLFIAGLAWMKVSPESLAALPKGFTSLSVPWHLPEFHGTDNAMFEFFGAMVILWVVKGLMLNAGGPGQMYDFQRFLAARNSSDAAKVGAAWSVFLVVRWAMAMGIALLALTGMAGVTDPEQVMPIVLRDYLPVGVRGLVLAGLLAAFMSTFSATINCAASFVVRDLWQPYFKPDATQRQSVRCSYIATVAVVIVGILIGFKGESISKIWSWLMMALGGSVLVPNVLRWYWWRLNGWGYAAGTLAGVVLAVCVFIWPDLPIFISFPGIVLGSLLVCLVVSYTTPPVGKEVLVDFYQSVHPFGFWGHVAHACPGQAHPGGIARLSLNLVLAMLAIFGAYVCPMYLVGHWYGKGLVWLAVVVVTSVILYFTWYKTLVDDDPESVPALSDRLEDGRAAR